MKKIVSNVLVVATQLIVGGLFLFMLFSDNNGDNKVVAVNNNNLDKMADAVAILFDAEENPEINLLSEDAKKREEVLKTAEQRKAEEEAAKKAAEEEAARKKAEEEAAKKKAEEEAARKAAEEEAAKQRAAAAISSNQSVASLQEYAHNLVISTYGWSEADFVALVNLWNKESGWGVTSGNPSGAYGIPQSLPGNKMASEGSDWATNGQTQIRWGLKYIRSTYGSPANAWNHFLGHNWY